MTTENKTPPLDTHCRNARLRGPRWVVVWSPVWGLRMEEVVT